MGILDLHCDTIGVIYQEKKKGSNISLKKNNLQIDIEKLKNGNYFAQCFAMFVWYKVDNPYQVCKDMIEVFYQELNKNDELSLALSYKDLVNNSLNNKISAILTIEEGGVVDCSIDKLVEFYNLGVRMICLNWNFDNGIGHNNYGLIKEDGKPDFTIPNTENGLTQFGFEMVKKMNELGMVVDVSHLSDKGFWDVINTSTKPIMASHSNARAICKHVRNLTDDMIIALNKNGGVMGMNYCNSFMDNDEIKGKNTIDCTIRHMKHIKDLVGVDVIALGSDFDGIDPDIELKDASMYQSLVCRMREEGFTDEEIEKITYKNALRVFEASLK